MDAGGLVSDDIMVNMIKDQLENNKSLELEGLSTNNTTLLRTFCQSSSVELASFEFDCDYMSQRFVKEFDGDTETASHGDRWWCLRSRVVSRK